ncbi:uncharacterized protein LOC114075380 [Solanum pennellii]|uniref:Uncharacterized protein LOC114075380 n=1 Tax=Solanum pennellii TaxID=28526 RepID=A0ABM1V1M9_SOLPN|nr:uncharacterized protein LOC114075380 [Solanum pennellii]
MCCVLVVYKNGTEIDLTVSALLNNLNKLRRKRSIKSKSEQQSRAKLLIRRLSGSTNYPTWKSQVTTLLFGYDLLTFVDSSLPIPNVQSLEKDNNKIPNPNLRLCNKTVLFVILLWHYATITPLIAHASTSKEAWDILQTNYASKSHSKNFSLRDTLANVKRDARSISDYMREIKSIEDDLACIGSPVNSDEVVIKVLSGLGAEYKELSTTIRARDNPITFEELFDKLLEQEMFIKYSDLKSKHR